MKFKHLNVPSHWEHYWTRYPEGYTILEALISWVSQVDDMVDNVNDWNTYLDEFVKTFDKELQTTVFNILTDWDESGFLADIINEATNERIDVVEENMTDLDNKKIDKGNASVTDINKNLGKFDQTYMSDEFLQQITGNTPINTTPADKSITTVKLADESVTNQKLSDDLLNRLNYLDFTFTEGSFINNVGETGLGPAYAYTNLIDIAKGEEVEIMAGGTANVAVIAEYDTSGNFVRTIQQGQGFLATYTFRANANTKIRITNSTSYLPHELVYVRKTNLVEDSSITQYQLSDLVKKQVGFIPTQYIFGEFIASSSHASGAGAIGYGVTYMRSEPFMLRAGETLKTNAVSSASTLLLAVVDEDGNYIRDAIVGSASTAIKSYTATSDEYLILTNNRANVPFDEFYVTYGERDSQTPTVVTNTGGYTPRRPMVNFIFDDGTNTDSVVANAFEARGLRCGFAIPSNVGLSNHLPLQEKGFEIISHSVDGTGFNTSGLTNTRQRMKQSKNTLQNAGATIQGWVTPSSQMREEYISDLKGFYNYGFTQYLGVWTPDSAETPYDTITTDTYHLKRMSAESSTIADCKTAIDETIANNGLLSFYGHNLRADRLTESELNELLDYIVLLVDDGKIICETPYNAISDYYKVRREDIG